MTEQPPRKDYGSFDNFMRWSGRTSARGGRWFWALPWKAKGPAMGGGALILLIAIGNAGGSDKKTEAKVAPDSTASATVGTDKPTNTPKPTDTPKATNTPKPTETPKPTATPAPPTATPEPAGFSFGSGKKLVGSEVALVTYRTRTASAGCYWERLTGLGGTLAEIAANDNASGPAVVTIQQGDVAFNSTRCAKWTQDLSAINSDPSAPFSDGTYIIGVDIAPGVWRSDGPGSCYWQRMRGFTGRTSDIIANDNATGSTIVQIGAGDKGFSSSRCGKWTKQ